MSAEWYYQIMGEDVGPLSAAELRMHAQDGRITPATLIRKGSAGQWVSADRVRGLLGREPSKNATAPMPPPISQERPDAAVAKRTATNPQNARWKSIAGVFVLLLGGAFQMIPVFLGFTMAMSSRYSHKEPSLIPVALVSLVIVLLGWPCFKGGTPTKVIYILLTGILPGYVVIKGWEAIEEGQQRQQPPT